jgi:hypothetical protein
MTERTRAVIFLGPTLPVAEAQTVLDAVYLPPARQADLVSVITTYRPQVIGLIDGVFGQSLSVWHKEILFALSLGIRVYGASSLGALRAAETAPFGMVGVGEVYRLYASGDLTDDDDVALAHGDAASGFRPASVPMVNLRKTLERAKDEGLLDDDLYQRWLALAKAIYFPDRTIAAVLRRAHDEGIPRDTIERVAHFVATGYVDVKRQDAMLLLQTIRDLPDPLPPSTPSFDLVESPFFDALYQRDRTVRHSGVDVPLHSIADYAVLHRPQLGAISFHAMNRALAVRLADLLGITASREDIEREVGRFRQRLQLTEDELFAAWLGKNDLTSDEISDLMREVALCRRLHRWLILQRLPGLTTKLVLDELRLTNEYEGIARAAASHERVLQVCHPDLREVDQDGAEMEDLLLEHLGQTGLRLDTDLAEWAEEAGFPSLNDLRIELLRARLVRQELLRVSRALDFLMETPEDS